MAGIPQVAFGAGFVGSTNNKLATVDQKLATAAFGKIPLVSYKNMEMRRIGASYKIDKHGNKLCP